MDLGRKIRKWNGPACLDYTKEKLGGIGVRGVVIMRVKIFRISNPKIQTRGGIRDISREEKGQKMEWSGLSGLY
jgi:hypothetical protein